MKIAIGSDHAGFSLKEKIRKYLAGKGYSVTDKGCFSEERADYPDFGHAVALAVENKEAETGILLCGSGNGINMAANKHKGIRSALCWTEEIARLARQHNNANVLALPARFISEEEAGLIADTFLTTAFEGGRHADRVSKI
ncbi:MAG TPA: ribose 5-phosphate isomerase B [Bacteroidia bacterium]|nr:ribose 5-phosphate isomerase B [Bacteroidia bacterium]